MKSIDICGLKFGSLTVIRRGENIQGRYKWDCICDCGKTTSVLTSKLKNGHTKSCGCFQASSAKDANTTHGFSSRVGGRAKEYRTWSAMKTRCLNKRSSGYYLYGARGVKICQEWMKFENFIKDMGLAPSGEYSIERIDPNGDYEPSNCKWATISEQANNKRSTRWVTINGKTMSATNWAKFLGVSRKTTINRYAK